MEVQDIKKNLLEISDYSVIIYNASRDNNVLFDFIDALPISVKTELHSKYVNSSGPVLGIRKQIVDDFLNGPVDRTAIANQFEIGKRNTPKNYTQYKNLYAVLYPFLSYSTNSLVYNTLENFAVKLRLDLQFENETDIKTIGFDGGRNTGSDLVWFAIYNNSYPNQQNAKQLFFSILNAVVTYAFYDRGKDLFLEKVTCDVASLDYSAVLNFYKKYKSAILLDNYRANILSKYPLGKLINQLESGQIKSWLIKPGEKGSMWKKALKEENIRIGWGCVVEDIYDENRFDDEFILGKLDEYYPRENTRQTNNKTTIKSFLLDVTENDVVFAVSGTADIIGLGIVTSKTELDEEDNDFKAYHKVDWLVDLVRTPYKPDYGLPIKTVTGLEARYSVPIICSIFNYTLPVTQDKMELPFLNTILYGPPGTGKTYELCRYQKILFTDRGISKTSEEVLSEKIAAYPLWKVIGAVLGTANTPLSVTDILQHPIVKVKIPLESKTPRNSAWRSLQSYADDSSTQLEQKYRGSLKLFHKAEYSQWTIIEDKKEDLSDIIDQDLLDIAANPVPLPIQNTASKTRFNFITFHQKYSYEDFIEGIKPLLQKNNTEEEQRGDLQFELKKGILYNSCLSALKLAGYESFVECFNDSFENRETKFNEVKRDVTKQFALFIDEINRANISAVFGELITLLEDNKRMGADNETWVKLPYSNEDFCVPGNLYVIGTMNTADRSIALLDIALRRRFEFISLYPSYPENQWWSQLLVSLNQAIYNWKKNPDFFIGHTFFLNKLETDRAKVFNTKIIPLLYEYCQNNADTVKRILSEAGIQFKTPTIKENFQVIAE